MRSPTFDEAFAMLLAVQLCAGDVARLREWIAGIAQPAECIALIEQAAAGRPCPHCGCPADTAAARRADSSVIDVSGAGVPITP